MNQDDDSPTLGGAVLLIGSGLLGILVFLLFFSLGLLAGCGGDSDNGGTYGKILEDAAAEAAALDAEDADCTQTITADNQSTVNANQNCGTGNRIGSDGQTGDNSTSDESGHNTSDRHDTTTTETNS